MTLCPYCENPFPPTQTTRGRTEVHPCSKCRNPVLIRPGASGTTAEPVAGARDIREDSPPDSVGGAILSVLHKSRYQLPMLPHAARRIREKVSGDAAAVHEIVSTDPIVAARVLAAANGEIFGGLERAVDLDEAIQRLGPERIREELQALASGPSYGAEVPMLAKKLEETWKNGLFVAHCAREIGRATSAPNPEMLYLAGLLHDIGKYLLFDVVESGSGEAITAMRGAARLFEETIHRFHPLVGLHLAHRWRFPAEIGIAAFAHHDDALVPDEEFEYVVRVVTLANDIAHATGYGSPFDDPVSLLAHPANRRLQLSDVRIATIRIDLSDHLRTLLSDWGFEAVPLVA